MPCKASGCTALQYVGARRSLTGLNADQWIDARPGSEMAIIGLLSGSVTPQQAAQESGADVAVLAELQREFAATRPALVLASGASPRGMEVCLAANALSQASGGAIRAGEAYNGFEGIDSPSQLRVLAQRMQSGAVPLLMTRGVNPAYTMPKSSGFAAAMAKVPFKVSFSSIPDETSAWRPCSTGQPFARKRGDAERVRGTLSLQHDDGSVFDTGRRQMYCSLSSSACWRGCGSAAAAAVAAPSYRDTMIARFEVVRTTAQAPAVEWRRGTTAVTPRAVGAPGLAAGNGEFFSWFIPRHCLEMATVPTSRVAGASRSSHKDRCRRLRSSILRRQANWCGKRRSRNRRNSAGVSRFRCTRISASGRYRCGSGGVAVIRGGRALCQAVQTHSICSVC